MRRIIDFQVVQQYAKAGELETTRGEIVYALTHDGILWRRGEADSTWRAIEPPGDGDPFKPEMTQEKLLKRLARGDGFPKGGK